MKKKNTRKFQFSTHGRIIIPVLLPGHSYFDHNSVVISIDPSMLFGLIAKNLLRTVAGKKPSNPKADLEDLNVTIF